MRLCRNIQCLNFIRLQRFLMSQIIASRRCDECQSTTSSSSIRPSLNRSPMMWSASSWIRSQWKYIHFDIWELQCHIEYLNSLYVTIEPKLTYRIFYAPASIISSSADGVDSVPSPGYWQDFNQRNQAHGREGWSQNYPSSSCSRYSSFARKGQCVHYNIYVPPY